MRSFSFQGFPAEKVQDEVNQGSQGEAGQGGEQVGSGRGKGRSREVNWFILMALTEGQREERGRDFRVGT